MPKEKPPLNRSRQLRREQQQYDARVLAARLVQLLEAGETLGMPERRGAQIVVPVERAAEKAESASAPAPSPTR